MDVLTSNLGKTKRLQWKFGIDVEQLTYLLQSSKLPPPTQVHEQPPVTLSLEFPFDFDRTKLATLISQLEMKVSTTGPDEDFTIGYAYEHQDIGQKGSPYVLVGVDPDLRLVFGSYFNRKVSREFGMPLVVRLTVEEALKVMLPSDEACESGKRHAKRHVMDDRTS